MITECNTETDFRVIYEIINDAAMAYKGVIPADRWQEPYMPEEELKIQIEEGVHFWKYMERDRVLGVMGFQDKNAVNLIRHAYVRTEERNRGIGGKLLRFLCDQSDKPLLVGTWADASWAIKFYLNHGFRLLPEEEKNRLLNKYWNIPPRQVETSVVLASQDYGSNQRK